MLRAKYSNSKDFYHLINAMSKLSDTIILNFTKDGINSKYLTEDKILMGILNLPKDVLEEYEIEKEMSVKLDLNYVKKFLGKARSSKSSVEITETDAGIKITIVDNKTGTKSNIYVKGEKGEPQPLKEPNVSLPVLATLPGDVFKTVIDDAETIGEEVIIEAEEDSVKISAEESGKSYTAILRRDKPITDLSIDKPSKSAYSLEVLKTAASVSSFTDNLRMGFGSNLPLKLEASGENGASLIFWVAPRI
ncbi:MAG: DNA polymerase sliding clamp [Candidatus Aramenus sulfurataquae]|jgi:proliferating cell nuclear antigen|nr:DNA polymerase sliding clamp [Candidatus Aramenus sulfurataquae]